MGIVAEDWQHCVSSESCGGSNRKSLTMGALAPICASSIYIYIHQCVTVDIHRQRSVDQRLVGHGVSILCPMFFKLSFLVLCLTSETGVKFWQAEMASRSLTRLIRIVFEPKHILVNGAASWLASIASSPASTMFWPARMASGHPE